MEIANGLLMAVRRKRIAIDKARAFLDAITSLPITAESGLTAVQARSMLTLSEKHRLTVYDAIYLDLAMRRGLALATLDSDLLKAARAEEILLL